jgi:hypothetical protein
VLTCETVGLLLRSCALRHGTSGLGLGSGTLEVNRHKGRSRRNSAAGPVAPSTNQDAVGTILTGSFFASVGSGIVTSMTPSWVFALIFLASTPAGSAITRRKDP